MDNTLMTVIGIFLTVTLIFVMPLMSMSERSDDIAQSVVQTATSEFVDKISISGLIKPNDYEEYVQKLSATGNTYDIEIEVQHLDENFGKKNGTTSKDLIGENQRYSTFTTEILDNMYLEDGNSQNYVLNKGDNVIVTAKNTNKTMAQTLRTFVYKVTGQGMYEISAISSSMVVNGEAGKVETATTITNPTDSENSTIPEESGDLKVTFDKTEGDYCSEEYKMVKYRKKYGILPTPIREGYEFVGWFTGINSGRQVFEHTEVKRSDNHTLYARWTEGKYRVTFNANGGICEIVDKIVVFNSKYGELPGEDAVRRTGYTFNGWFTTSIDGIQITEETIVNTGRDHTIYAQWTPNTYTVTYDANGGTVSPTSKEIKYGDIYGELPVPTKEGYVFREWNEKQDGTGKVWNNENTSEWQWNYTEDITLYAQWVELPNANIEFIEEDRSYAYSDSFGDYKVISKTPSTGGETAQGKDTIVINVTFSYGEYTGNQNQYILGAQDSSGYEIYIPSGLNKNRIIFGIWNTKTGAYENLEVDISNLNVYPKDILNVTAMYDGKSMKLYVRKEGMNDYKVNTKEIELQLNQNSLVPTLIGENPGRSVQYEKTEGYIPRDGFHEYEASYFTGKIYNARVWFNQTFTDRQIDLAYNQGVNEAIDLVTYNGHRYYTSIIETKNWEEAKTRCEEMGGHLVTITSQEELDFVEGIIDRKDNKNYWLGATDKGSEGTWRWVTYERFEFKNWQPGQPDNAGGNEHYLHMWSNANFKWNDAVLEGPYGTYCYYICEWKDEEDVIPEFVGNAYYVSNEQCTWQEAKQKCEQMGGHLATITSQEEKNFIDSIIEDKYYWLGATDEGQEGTWKWITGEDFKYSNWNEYEPGKYEPNDGNDGPGGNKENYLHIYGNGKWNDIDSNNQFYFICEWETDNAVLTRNTEYVNHRYYISNEKLNWQDAKGRCELMGGHLATITSQEEKSFIDNIVRNGDCWLGATDERQEGKWEWITGENFKYSNWSNSEPNNLNIENYLVLYRNGQWNDLNPNNNLHFICESYY